MTEVFGLEDTSLLLMFLVIEGRRLGKLALSAKGNDRYTEEHARLLWLLN
ncbi:MAG: hypothetical protein ACE5JI_17095 [Acidobacteriota bacterium]